jgi:hypothetical protein
MAKRFILGSTIAAIALGIFSTNTVFAAGDEITYRGPNGVSPAAQPGEEPGFGLLDEYRIAYIAEQLNVTAEEIQVQLDGGLTLSQVLLDYGVVDCRTMTDATHAYAIEQLNADGIVIPGWQNSGSGMGMGAGTMLNRYGRSSR